MRRYSSGSRAALAAACMIAALSCATRAADATEKVFDLTVTGGTLPATQRVMRVDKGDAVRWLITSDAPGALHLHAYRIETHLSAGTPAEIAFKAFATGRFRVEWHADAAKAPPSGAHHAAPLAIFEVRPR